MRKAWIIALKDTLIRFRDRNALLWMLAAPLVIAAIMGAAFGDQGGTPAPITEIPLIVIDQDQGDLGERFIEVMLAIEVDTPEGNTPLFAVARAQEVQPAVLQVEQGKVRGVVVIPSDFSQQLEHTQAEESEHHTAAVQVYTDPTSSISTAIIQGVVQRITNGFNTIALANQVAVAQLVESISDIPLILVNADPDLGGTTFAEILASDAFGGLFTLRRMTDLQAARQQVETGQAEALIYLPPEFTQTLLSGAPPDEVAAALEVYTAPNSFAASLVRDLAQQIVRYLSAGAAGPVLPPRVLSRMQHLGPILEEENARFAEKEGPRQRISIRSTTLGAGEEFNLLAFFVPSMAIFFLMFTMFEGTRSILEEERDGTLHRLMTTPTGISHILLGKIGGAFLTGILQFVVLLLASALLFRLDWGRSPLGLALLVIATVVAATSLGAFVVSFARDVNQAGVLGTVITLVFSMLGGNFITTEGFPAWLNFLSKLTINRWSLDGFVTLMLNKQGVAQVLPNIAVLFALAVVFFALAVRLFNRRFVR